MLPIMFQIAKATKDARARRNNSQIGTEVEGGQGRIVQVYPPAFGGPRFASPTVVGLSKFMNVADLPAALDAL